MSAVDFAGTTDEHGKLPISWTDGVPLIEAFTPADATAAQVTDSSGAYVAVQFLGSDGIPLAETAATVTIRTQSPINSEESADE